jgi:F-type H+-transporting ATPase subunit epsilon
MATLHCTIVTPERAVYEADVDKVTLPAWDGEVGILPRHARFLARLGAGVLRVSGGGGTEEMFVDGGFVQVADDRVTVLTHSACAIPDIDVPAAQAKVDGLRGMGRGPELADATQRLLTMKRVKDRFNRS